MLVVAGWTYHAVRESLEQLLGDQLRATLSADVAALLLWADNEKAAVEAWAELQPVRENVIRLAKSQTDLPSARAALRRLLGAATDSGDLRGYIAIDTSGRVLSAYSESLVGRRLAAQRLADLSPVLAGQTQLIMPFKGLSVLPDIRIDRPIMLVAAPVTDEGGEIHGALALRLDPNLDFTRIFTSARVGYSGETYAFDSQARMLSASRFQESLQSSGLLGSDPEATSVLAVQIRDPGGDLTRGHVNDTPISSRGLTRMAALALSGEDGMDLDGYRDYRGVEVIGTWRWLGELEIGVVTEMDKAEAYRVLRPLGLAFAGLLMLLLLALLGLVAGSYVLARLHRRADQLEQLGQYRLLERIGEGGMAVVYRAEHAMLRRPTAIKLLKTEMMSEETVQRFEREVQRTAELTHPNTIEIFDYGRTRDGVFFYAMELIDGVSLADLLLRTGPMAPGRVIHVLRQIAGSLLEAHELGLIHRDVKPPNIMLCLREGQGDVAKLLDFGLVKDIVGDSDPTLTTHDVVAGTPQYIAPERIRTPECVDARADLYALGAVAFNLLTARDVFPGSTSMEIVHQVLTAAPPRIDAVAEQAVPLRLVELIDRCLDKAPDGRPASSAELLTELESLGSKHPWAREDAVRWWKTLRSVQ
jgi:hypothetical protein